MKEYNVKELPNINDGVVPTGEIGVGWIDGRWERNGQIQLCPLSRLILRTQPQVMSWLRAASRATGWSMTRTLAFKLTMGKVHLTISKENHDEASKGVQDAKLYSLLYELSRKTNRPRPNP